jgi:cholesterol transport system auxiliary component
MSAAILPPLSRRFLLVGGASLALSACSSIIGPTPDMQLYVLKPQIPKKPGPAVNWRLTILKPEAAQSLDTNRISISRSPTTMDYYANAVWADRVTDLVQEGVETAFEDSGRISAVAEDSVGAEADYDLNIDVQNFEARYDTPDGAPTAVVRLHVKLVARLRHNILGDYETVHETPASQNSVDAAVLAFDQAFGAALADVVDWTLRAAPAIPA